MRPTDHFSKDLMFSCLSLHHTTWKMLCVRFQLQMWNEMKSFKKVTYFLHDDVALLVWMRIFIFGMNSEKEALIHVYGYLGNVKSWFLKSFGGVHFLHYENLQKICSFLKNEKKLLYKIEFPAFSQKDTTKWFWKSWFCIAQVPINMY